MLLQFRTDARPVDNGSSKQQIKCTTFSIIFPFFLLIITNSFFLNHSSGYFFRSLYLGMISQRACRVGVGLRVKKKKIIDVVKLNQPGGHHQSLNDDNLISLTLSAMIESHDDVCCPLTIQYTRVDGVDQVRNT